MPEVTGRQVRLFSLHSQQQAQRSSLWACRRSTVKRKRAAAFSCKSYRSEPEETSPAHKPRGPARSRLLSERTRTQQATPTPSRGRLIRRTETPPEVEREAPQNSGRLLQRSQPITTTTKGLTRSTDTLRKSKQGISASKHSEPQDSAKQNEPAQSKVSTHTRFSQVAGKLSQKDWQVRRMMLTARL